MAKPINIDDAIRHLTEKIGDSASDGRSFKPSRYDVRCLNSIIKWRDRDRLEKVSQNVLFSKMYVYVFYQILIHLETTDVREVSGLMNDVLKKPYSLLVQEFMMFADTYLESQVLKEAGFPELSSHVPGLRSDEENKKLREACENAPPDVIEKLIATRWKYEDAIDLFDELISNATNIYSNIP